MTSAPAADRRPCRVFRALTRLILGMIAAVSVASALPACASKPKEVKSVDVPARDVPDFLRGTIGAETVLVGAEPVLVSGLGIVVGLNGTGGGELPVNISGTMERELGLRGVGRGRDYGQLGGMSPAEFLRSKNVAVVIVEARIAPGSPKGARFDVFVRTLPGSSVTSLEGGRLWTTDLRLGPAAVFGARKTRKIAEADGALYINPFSDTLGGASASDVDASRVTVTRTFGRVLDGGVVTDPLRLAISLDNPSHSRARSMVNAINSRFPTEPGQRDPTARGRSGDSITLEMPRSFAENPEEFIQTIRYLRIDPAFPDAAAQRYLRALKEQPGYSQEIMWCLVALGDVARKQLADLYDYPELAPRMAALEAGARLGDPRTVTPLIEIARSAPQTGMRLAAIDLLGKMRNNPNVNFAMRDLVNAPQLEIRVAAYEALSRLRDPTIRRTPIAGPDPRVAQFVVEEVPSSTPMIYVTQQGEPRIAVFGGWKLDPNAGLTGGPVQLSTPLIVSMWDDRLLFNADAGSKPKVRYKDERRGRTVETQIPGEIAPLVEFLARFTTPEDPRPGLALGYSEIVGVLYELTRQHALDATFMTEEDKLRAEVYAASTSVLNDRPEDSERAEDIAIQVFRPLQSPSPAGAGTVADRARGDESMRSKIVPLAAPKQK